QPAGGGLRDDLTEEGIAVESDRHARSKPAARWHLRAERSGRRAALRESTGSAIPQDSAILPRTPVRIAAEEIFGIVEIRPFDPKQGLAPSGTASPRNECRAATDSAGADDSPRRAPRTPRTKTRRSSRRELSRYSS